MMRKEEVIGWGSGTCPSEKKMAHDPNCSLIGDQLPLSSEIFQVIKAQIWIFLIPVFLGLVQVGLFLEQTGFFLRHGKSSHRTSVLLWILGVYPVFNLTSLICLYIPRASFVCNFVASIYHSITLWKFLALIRDFFGGSERMLQELAGKRVSPNPFPCCCCCCLPEIAANRANLRCMTVAVYQLSLIRTILFFITLILWTDDEYDYGAVGYTNPNSYINVIIAISTFLSFYGYLLFYKATKPALEGYNLRYKFVCIILVLVLCGLQSGIVETMGALGAIPCSPSLSPVTRSQMIYYYALAIEMFFIGIFAHYSFRRIEPSMEAEQVIHHQASQTQEGPSGRCSPADGVSMEGTNPGYLCDEAFCTIEHSPLDRFDFIVKEPVNRQQPSWGLGCQRGGALKAEGLTLSLQQPGTEVSGEIQIQSHVNKMEANGASAV
ncbi:organic solute transporter subunit alpha-like isoform X2 [Ahaetulla prasina]|uniref:organic solute transporter subunit alpha-like isoform X2 n=1 Tax=Ahaetulla prasina TaxID=499056 RepID=UPI00264734EB|nr:organic solute transporter subunit alpha-like isoform X2 [Ahaetulla prasina]